MSQEGFLSGASIFHASQIGDIMRLKELIAQGVSVNRANAYGCIPLHYAVKNAAECAAVVARGGDEINSDGAKVRHLSSALQKCERFMCQRRCSEL